MKTRICYHQGTKITKKCESTDWDFLGVLGALVVKNFFPVPVSDQELAAGEKIPGGDEKKIPGGVGILFSI